MGSCPDTDIDPGCVSHKVLCVTARANKINFNQGSQVRMQNFFKIFSWPLLFNF